MKLEVDRQQVPEVLSSLLSTHTIKAVGVQDRPLEDVIAEMFTTGSTTGIDRQPTATAT